MRCYTDIDFMPPPLKCPENIYNTWSGFDAERITEEPNEEGVKLLLDHISMLCNNDQAVSDFFNKWIAHMIQFPGIKPGVAILIRSPTHGVGKECLLKILILQCELHLHDLLSASQ